VGLLSQGFKCWGDSLSRNTQPLGLGESPRGHSPKGGCRARMKLHGSGLPPNYATTPHGGNKAFRGIDMAGQDGYNIRAAHGTLKKKACAAGSIDAG